MSPGPAGTNAPIGACGANKGVCSEGILEVFFSRFDLPSETYHERFSIGKVWNLRDIETSGRQYPREGWVRLLSDWSHGLTTDHPVLHTEAHGSCMCSAPLEPTHLHLVQFSASYRPNDTKLGRTPHLTYLPILGLQVPSQRVVSYVELLVINLDVQSYSRS